MALRPNFLNHVLKKRVDLFIGHPTRFNRARKRFGGLKRKHGLLFDFDRDELIDVGIHILPPQSGPLLDLLFFFRRQMEGDGHNGTCDSANMIEIYHAIRRRGDAFNYLDRDDQAARAIGTLIAQLGGYIRRKDSAPGTQAVWIGMQRRYDPALAWEIFGPESKMKGS